jgi:1-aminocyclopropane-1-carboxylate deaminase
MAASIAQLEEWGVGRQWADGALPVPGVYGVPDETTLDAIRAAARLEGMLTDPVYEGKSMAGLIGMVRSGEIPAGSNVLYAHLGGQPALSAYAGVL